MFKRIRVLLAVVSIVATTLLFVDFTGLAQEWWGWIAKIQLVPAFLSLNVAVIVFLSLLALICGRAYCSIICPLGIFQDVITHVRGWVGKKKNRKNRFNYAYPKTWLRITVLIIFSALLILGLCNIVGTTLASFIEPYSAYGRIASSIMTPIYKLGNNAIAEMLIDTESYIFNSVEIYNSIPLVIIAVITIAVVGCFAWFGGRLYCNTICPVGTLLGFFSHFSYLKPVIDTSKCNGCTKCARNCKSSCIDAKNHKIDYSRCVVCMDCIENCTTGAISFCRNSKKDKANQNQVHDENRRNFMTIGAMLATATAMSAADKTTDGGLAVIIDKEKPQRKTPITPPGAISISNLQRHCTGCQLCITSCENGVLRPSTELDTFMQPIVEFEKGYCRPECVKCSNVCPTGAIRPISVEDKSSIQIGRAIVNLDACIMASKGKKCGNCADKCPSAAIKLVAINPNVQDSKLMPVVNESRCIGCGACEYYCPVRPISAIYVNGNDVQRVI